MCNQGETLPQHQPKSYDVSEQGNMNPTTEPQPKMDAVLINMGDEQSKKHFENNIFCQCQAEQCVKRRKYWSGCVDFCSQVIGLIILALIVYLVISFYDVSFMIIAALSSTVVLGFIAIHHEILRDIQKQIIKSNEKLDQTDATATEAEGKRFWEDDLDKKVIFRKIKSNFHNYFKF